MMAGNALWAVARHFESLAFAFMRRDPAHADAKLVALIAEFNAVTDLIESKYSCCLNSIEEHEAALAAAPWESKQDALLAQICAMRAVTRDGLRARAECMLHWDAGVRSRAAGPDNTIYPVEDRMLAALLRDLMALRPGRPDQQTLQAESAALHSVHESAGRHSCAAAGQPGRAWQSP
jgi:hypothetical protein